MWHDLLLQERFHGLGVDADATATLEISEYLLGCFAEHPSEEARKSACEPKAKDWREHDCPIRKWDGEFDDWPRNEKAIPVKPTQDVAVP